MATGASSASVDSTLFPLCTFLLSIYTLGISADVFISSTARVAHRLHVSETLVSLLTAGAEWEELAVVVAAVAQRQPKIALGNVLGSCVANIFGAFSLGVLAQRQPIVTYDVSAKIYAVVLFGVTTAVAVLWGFGQLQAHVYGAVLVVAFALYLAGIGWSIYRGVLAAPVESDAESDADGSDSESDGDPEVQPATVDGISRQENSGTEEVDESSALIGRRRKRPSTLLYLARLILAFIALSISGYVLAHSSHSLAAKFNISETVFGATLLSLATTLPEKFVAVISGYRGHPGIMVANTVGSNIFLLTLCLGVTILSSKSLAQGSSYTNEIVWSWTSSAFLTVMILLGTHRLVGLAMLLAYVAFIVLEFTLYKP
ncbi:uncharacterized protein Z520_06912 [Fonsecaea multimorphosa CBS 102226]|uniref:Sodium/calcium exchanger membrane region domain-containing protein n=1 Tax=Fonsecaea multimorphosa CBS 102226 TaxID=1442371 RepID=A0A0D2H6K3_9EURO|nr:uncharacterized protein Z520_06912 [Fonsecaea multimorphosa CBS 102226]KIX97460.1 hypothetical protein Z520_06912 [Fonsecaea multimorphosa CBS 102226]OAL23425.1 hypothetical protein AYO22_06475 [Fonsecaea multimorphosa]